MTIKCPAKVNLFLSVGGLDSNNYHPIRTVFQAISLCDILEIERAESDSFECLNDQVPAENTVTKAWRFAKEYLDFPKLNVVLHKAVPVQSGLGGGSSDAAGLLRGLIKVSKGRFSLDEAKDVAKAVGADVSFFLMGGLAKATGYGEILEPQPDLEKRHLVVVMPSTHVSTPNAYGELDKQERKLAEFPPEHFGANDFESVAPQSSKDVIQRLSELGATFSALTGSGAAVFGLFPSVEVTRAVAQTLRRESVGEVFVCHTLTREESVWIS